MLSSSVLRYLLLLIILNVISINTGFEWPFLQTCTIEDEKCHIAQVDTFFKLYAKGEIGLDLPSLDPMYLGNISANGNSNENFRFQLIMEDTKLYKFPTSKCLNIKGFTRNTKKSMRHLMTVLSPKMIMETRCHIKGKILIFNLEGSIDMSVDINNLTTTMSSLSKPFTKDDHIYWKVEELKPRLNIGGLFITFKNSTLFGGDPLFMDSFADTINANWSIFRDEIEPLLNLAVAKVLKEALNKILPTMPYDKFFKEE